MNEQFIKSLYSSIVDGNIEEYKTLFEEDNADSNIIDYWKKALEFYGKIDEHQKDIFFSIIKSTIIDTISNVLGVIDGSCALDDSEWNFKININGRNVNSELQDDFLNYIETLESENDL